jgi:hypothetical protein
METKRLSSVEQKIENRPYAKADHAPLQSHFHTTKLSANHETADSPFKTTCEIGFGLALKSLTFLTFSELG